jgi:hypothetical protein
VQRGVHHGEVGEQQIAADGRELLDGVRVGAEAADHHGERLDLAQLRDALRDETPPGTSTNRTWAATVFFERSISVRTASRGSGTDTTATFAWPSVRPGARQGREQG